MGNEGVAIIKLKPELKFRISALHLDQESTSLLCREFIDHLKGELKSFLAL
jgi:hypothetical protein